MPCEPANSTTAVKHYINENATKTHIPASRAEASLLTLILQYDEKSLRPLLLDNYK